MNYNEKIKLFRCQRNGHERIISILKNSFFSKTNLKINKKFANMLLLSAQMSDCRNCQDGWHSK
ncbi:hypothetical protein H311_04463 [Anncaliia algerae PRA109]|nr:hypothetical protein H311_04463 [Anncaliia algerae PRA109]